MRKLAAKIGLAWRPKRAVKGASLRPVGASKVGLHFNLMRAHARCAFECVTFNYRAARLAGRTKCARFLVGQPANRRPAWRNRLAGRPGSRQAGWRVIARAGVAPFVARLGSPASRCNAHLQVASRNSRREFKLKAGRLRAPEAIQICALIQSVAGDNKCLSPG